MLDLIEVLISSILSVFVRDPNRIFRFSPSIEQHPDVVEFCFLVIGLSLFLAFGSSQSQEIGHLDAPLPLHRCGR
jgi:hypothetical protein